MAHLRAPDGCPWDREQTPASLKRYIIEEAYELCDAIDTGDPEHIKEELGDLLFQVVFQAQIAAERGQFTIQDVVDGISNKMEHRHPHVFGDETVNSAAEVNEQWEKRKAEEKAAEEADSAPADETAPTGVEHDGPSDEARRSSP